jgi:hypothetical protein
MSRVSHITPAGGITHAAVPRLVWFLHLERHIYLDLVVHSKALFVHAIILLSERSFLMLRMLSNHRLDLSVAALRDELNTAALRTTHFLQASSARVSITNVESNGGKLNVDVLVENTTGHKMPTAYPSRRAWLQVILRDRNGETIFESGALNPDGSIKGNINDVDPSGFEPHHREITSADQVQIYETILRDSQGHVTTGLLNALGYLKDNRVLPSGFDKSSAEKDIAVMGEAADDPNFTDKGSRVRYSVAVDPSAGSFHIEAELWYEPIAYRWAHNLSPYNAPRTSATGQLL